MSNDIDNPVSEILYTFTPITNTTPEVLSIKEIAITKLTNFKLTNIKWTEENKQLETYFVPVNSTSKAYNKRTQEFKLKRFFDDKEQTIAASNIQQITVITEEDISNNTEGTEFFLNQAEKHKNDYNRLKKSCSSVYDLDSCFFDPKLNLARNYDKLELLILLEIANISEYYNPSEETIKAVRKKLIELLQAKLANEKQNIENEFQTLSSEDSTANVELESILEFLSSIEEDTISKLNNANSIEDMVDMWPLVLGALISE